MKRHFVLFAWAVSLITVLLAVLTWIQCLGVPFAKLTTYDVFPLFGLLAFSLLWSHYSVGALSVFYGIKREKLEHWFKVTSLAVLGAILLHPGLLEYQMWRDGFGILPYLYVAPSLRWAVIIAQLAFIAFLAFEFHRWYKEKSWWHWVERASDVAMIVIFIHAYKLGCSLLPGWFLYVWYFYALTFTAALIYSAKDRHEQTGKWF